MRTNETKCARHNLSAAVNGCGCSMRDVTSCVVCGRNLPPNRDHVDTCRGKCYAHLLRVQRNATVPALHENDKLEYLGGIDPRGGGR